MNGSVRGLGFGAAGLVTAIVVLSFGAMAWLSASGRASGILLAVLLLSLLLLLVGVIAFIAVHASDQIRNPLRELHLSLQRISEGHLDERVIPQGTQETRRLAEGANDLAQSLAERERRLTHSITTDTIDALLSGIAHEINTPLSYMTINQKLLRRGAVALRDNPETSEETRAWATKATGWSDRNLVGIERLTAVTAALREVLRRGSDGRDVNLIVRATVGITHHRLPADMQLSLHLHASRHARVEGSVFFHALHALLLDIGTRNKGGKMLELTTRDMPTSVRLVLRHDGPPPPYEVLRLISEPARETRGLLAIENVQRAIHGEGGTFACIVDPTGATVWTIDLPAAAGASSATKQHGDRTPTSSAVSDDASTYRVTSLARTS